MAGLNLAQRSFVRQLYNQVNGCHSLVSNERAVACNKLYPTRSEVNEIVGEKQELEKKSSNRSPAANVTIQVKSVCACTAFLLFY